MPVFTNSQGRFLSSLIAQVKSDTFSGCIDFASFIIFQKAQPFKDHNFVQEWEGKTQFNSPPGIVPRSYFFVGS